MDFLHRSRCWYCRHNFAGEFTQMTKWNLSKKCNTEKRENANLTNTLFSTKTPAFALLPPSQYLKAQFQANFASGTFAVWSAAGNWWAPLRNPARKGANTSLVAPRYESCGTETSPVGLALPNAVGYFVPGRNQDLEGTISEKMFWASLLTCYSIFIFFYHLKELKIYTVLPAWHIIICHTFDKKKKQ